MNINIFKGALNTLLSPLKLYRQTGYASIDRPWDKGKTEIEVPDCNTYEYLLQRSNFNSSDILSRCHEDILTMDRLKVEVEAYAKSFQKLGVKKGDIVPLCIQNINEGLIAYFALNKIGAIATFLNATANKEEIEKYIKKYNSKVIMFSSTFSNIVNQVIDETSIENAVIVSTKDSILNGINSSKLTKEYIESSTRNFNETDNIMSLKRFKEIGKNEELVETKTSKDDDALICYTSGSTGDPKAIVLTNENIISEIISLKKTTYMQMGPQGNSMQVVPFYYPYGFIISSLLPMYVGKTTALTPILTMSNLHEYLKMYKPKYISGIPPLYKSMINDENIRHMDLSFIKYAVSGGDTFDITAKHNVNEFFRKHGSTAKVLDGSGNGEGCGSLTNPLGLFAKYNPYSVGRPLKGINIKITDLETNEEVEYGKVGRFCFSGKNVMREYYNDQDNTSSVKHIDNDGIEWFHTDTLAHMDSKGWVYIDGRERRFFITYDKDGSPYKVYCDFVQSILNKVTGIRDCAVVKKSDKDRYFVPKAYIVLDDGVEYNQELDLKIRLVCKQFLQNCAIPVEFEVIDSIPLTIADKVDYLSLEKICNGELPQNKQLIKKI